jgi:superfamily II DNA or RNA helicase
MSTPKSQKRKAKRKTKIKARRTQHQADLRADKAAFYYHEANWLRHNQSYTKALQLLKKALRISPGNIDYMAEMFYLGDNMGDAAVQLEGLLRLQRCGQLEDRHLPRFVDLLTESEDFKLALEMNQRLLDRLPEMKVPYKARLRTRAKQNLAYCRDRIGLEEMRARVTAPPKTRAAAPGPPAPSTPPKPAPPPKPAAPPPSLPDIPVSITVDQADFQQALTTAVAATWDRYEVALEAQRIRFSDSFENLICLAGLRNIQSLWYQEETARKVLKTFRGRALLSDEVGLGKTIEAAIVLKEYIQRGMVKSALILTPTPLVSQWREELKTKFDLDFPSTDDPHFRKKEHGLWDQPFVLASINQAKSKRNFAAVSGRDYDMVIVDEAHHLKNRNTLNWKLVNALKKRYLLLLTATPVENNLMELYNLITLLKPGQLKTATAFREAFMTKGDPTSPQNRHRLKGLLGQVMIRNTRALANINIPPRFAETIRVAPTASERELYERISNLVHDVNRSDGAGGNQLFLKTLLAEAGSSPRAVALTLSRTLDKRELPDDHLRQALAIHALSRSLADTRKNRILLDLIRREPGKKIIFVKYLGTLEHVSAFLDKEKIAYAIFHGGMPNPVKDAQIEAFQESRDILLTTEIGGEGRNLQFCHQMVNYDLPWNPMKIEQRIGRIHRIGQQHEVRIFNMCATGSIEDYILEILDRKINMFEMVIGEIDMILGRVRGEKDFADRVYDIWQQSASPTERETGFAKLAAQLKRSKTQYQTTRELDEKLFGENYEL